MNRLIILLLSFTLTACATHHMPALDPAHHSAGQVTKVFSVTNRQLGENAIYNGQRDTQLHYDVFDIWIPENRKSGKIQHAGKNFKPQNFAMAGHEDLTQAHFIQAMNQAMAAHDDSLFVFVHGYNMTFAHSIHLQAQIHQDYQHKSLPLHFSWPAAARTHQYLYDRESAMFSRRDFVQFLQLLHQSDAQQIAIMTHSMGSFLAVESLVKLDDRGHGDVIKNIDHLILASPDVDLDVFERQWRELRSKPQKTSVILSDRDRPLQSSAAMRQNKPRIGQAEATAKLEALGIAVIDLSHVKDNRDITQHFIFSSTPSLMGKIKYDE